MDAAAAIESTRLLAALANLERLRILALIADRAMTAAEIVAESGLEQDTVAAHLAVLGQAGLIATSKDGHERRVQLRTERLGQIEAACQEQLAARAPSGDASATIPAGIRQFFRDGRLTGFPSKQSRYREVLAVLAGDFSPETDYPEAEVNQILLRRNEDFATLRRDLVDFGFMTRANAVYRRTR
jgi:DNA-binding transcriptional ArsR family regulator